ncbi:uncharacterized protein PGTG_08092 [Puccinia graminis f. sp. tritici CRL 75-36-700-3]|uniref:Uncharacterized protein n=1 Tax=Puccinia graminis f. sp. tritici (strain CRL 75-36-700-3 / race SCCL) TaxID=418459 RepID=E3KC76_PUCGT|nr:uncharacterized protein PGTG_08092 [Puccinia graminis f. sp. tritici CRL 75-36-700-3]EFP81843.2 hypothetical protein PGTG_08092 [Puccinia graminis f. sp. tritici CRL 75-36-700-3]
MSPSTRSGKTYSEASSVTSSRRSSTTRSVHERKRQPWSIAQKDGDPLEAGQINPTVKRQLKPSSVKGNKPNVETNLAEAVRLTRQEKDSFIDSQESTGENRRETIDTIRTNETKAHLDPTTIREGQEETSHSCSHTDVNLGEKTSAVYSRPAENDPTTGAQLPSSTSLQDQSIPIFGRDGRRPTGRSRPERRIGSFDGYRTNDGRPGVQDISAAISHVRDSEEGESARRRNESADRVPTLVPQHLEEANLAEAKSAKLLAKLEGRSQPTASGSQPSGSYNSPNNRQEKRPAETDVNRLGKIAKLDTSWRETMAAARALQQARAQVLEELRKEEEASKRRKKD